MGCAHLCENASGYAVRYASLSSVSRDRINFLKPGTRRTNGDNSNTRMPSKVIVGAMPKKVINGYVTKLPRGLAAAEINETVAKTRFL